MQQNVKFASQSGVQLSGVLHTPDARNITGYAILAHCFTCTKSHSSGQNIAKSLAGEGIATLRFDFTGLGASKGQFSDTSFTTNVADLESAGRFLEENYGTPELMVGHSLGGTAVLAAASKMPSIKAVVSIGSPSRPDHILHMLKDKLPELKKMDAVKVKLGGFTHKFRQSFVDDVENYTLDIGNIGKAIMIMHAPFDDTVSITEASKIFEAAKHPKSFVSLDKSDHLLSNPEDAQYIGRHIGNWAKRYICSLETEASKELPKGVTVTGKTSEAFYNIASAGNHKFIIDEPLSYGGTDLGPTPYGLLGAALGSCTSMTLNGYARRKELNLTEVSVKVTHERIHAQDCDSCTKDEGKVDQFTRRITLQGNLSDDEKKRLYEIADLCPVHKTLENEIKIVTVSD